MILEAAKVREPRSELNPGVWQGDCFPGIEQNRSKMFRRPGMHMPVLWRADSHSPDDRAEIPLPAIGAARFRDAARNRRPHRPDITGRRRFRPGRDCSEWGDAS